MANFANYGNLESILTGYANKINGKADSTDVTNKANLKLATSGTTGTGEIRFGVDSNGNYGYIKAGADSVTPFKNPTGNKAIPQITQNGTVTDIDVADYATASLDIAVPAPVHTGTYTPAADTAANDMGANHTYRYVNTSGMIVPSGTKNVSIAQNGTITENVANYANAEITVAVPSNPNLQNKSVNPLIDSQSITKDSGYDGLGNVTVNGALGGSKGIILLEKGSGQGSNTTTTFSDLFTVNKGANALPDSIYTNPYSRGCAKITAKKKCLAYIYLRTEYNSPYEGNTHNVKVKIYINGVLVTDHQFYNCPNYKFLYSIVYAFEVGDTLEVECDLITTDKIHTYITLAEGRYSS